MSITLLLISSEAYIGFWQMTRIDTDTVKENIEAPSLVYLHGY